jgi:hypothetical protein
MQTHKYTLPAKELLIFDADNALSFEGLTSKINFY